MDITFIFGNGFDLQMGLQTRYSDFLNVYTSDTSHGSENILAFKRELRGKEQSALWADAERAMGLHLKGFSDATLDRYVERIQDFESKMSDYLTEQQLSCSYESAERIKTCFLDFIYNSFDDILNRRYVGRLYGSDNHYHFLSFNYTDLLENILSCCGSDGSGFTRIRKQPGHNTSDYFLAPLHIHGTLDSAVVMGVNDESQLDTSGGVTLTRQLLWKLIKPTIIQSSGQVWSVEAARVIDQSDVIAIYGVSFGATDKLWWKRIISWLMGNQNHRLICFDRSHPQNYDRRIPWATTDFEDQARTRLLTKLIGDGDPEMIEQLSDRVCIISNTKRLELAPLLHPSAVTIS